jgi:hypothetical protein
MSKSVSAVLGGVVVCAAVLSTGSLKADGPSAPCPPWVQEEVPDWAKPFLGRFGLPEPYPSRKEPLGEVTAGVDLWQANHFVAYRPETADYLYRQYTSVDMAYPPGVLPRYEKLVAVHTTRLKSDREKALALLTRAMPESILHPSIPPYGPDCPPNRAKSDEELLKSQTGWCNEQARVFVRLCQVAGIPARMIFLFYCDRKSGHVVAEFYADGRWSMVDSSWCCAFPDARGHLMSAAECHADSANRLLAGEAYLRRVQEVMHYPDVRLVGARLAHIQGEAERADRIRKDAEQTRQDLKGRTAKAMGEQLWAFGVMNYPLP